jgi:hypothetical protein
MRAAPAPRARAQRTRRRKRKNQLVKLSGWLFRIVPVDEQKLDLVPVGAVAV